MISREDAEKVARLARLGIGEDEAEKFQKELSAVLDYFKMIDSVDVSGVKPTFHPAEDFLKDESRKDVVKPESEEAVGEIVEAFPGKKDRHIKVKAIL